MNEFFEQLETLSLNSVYVVLSHDTQSPEVELLDYCFIKYEEADSYAKQHEHENNYQFYTSIVEVKIKCKI